jgi:membrane protease YdiL (CAAX protease family)
MKKINPLLLVVIAIALITGWETFGSEVFKLSDSQQELLVFVGFAPLMEEFIFRWLPIQFSNRLISNLGKKKWYFLEYAIMAIACYIFTIGHIGHYFNFGWHYAMLFQGVFSVIAWYVCKRGYWYAVIFHSVCNASLLLFSSQILT